MKADEIRTRDDVLTAITELYQDCLVDKLYAFDYFMQRLYDIGAAAQALGLVSIDISGM